MATQLTGSTQQRTPIVLVDAELEEERLFIQCGLSANIDLVKRYFETLFYDVNVTDCVCHHHHHLFYSLCGDE